MKNLGSLLGSYSGVARAINNNGQIVGAAGFSSYSRPFLLNPQGPVQLLGGNNGGAYGINDQGQVVGSAGIGPSGQNRAFIWTPNDGIKDLNLLTVNLPSGVTLQQATCINNLGQIVGVSSEGAFLLTPPPVPYLFFNPISSPQTIGNPFPVTISARKVDGSVDTSFNGEVILSSSVPVGPSFVYLSNGVWSGQVNVLGDGSNLVLQAMGGGLSGTSNPFSTAGAATVSGNLSGVVTNDAATKVPIAGAKVHLSLAANGPDAYPPQTTDASGRYAFSGVAGGNYYLWATYLGATGSTSYQVAVPAWAIAKNLQIPTAGSPSQLPVILVPGIMGSTIVADVVPRLKKSACKRNQLQLFDLKGMVGWGDLKKVLQQRGVKVIECPWDWRKPINEAMEEYLKEAIKEAKDAGYQKVNIIAHSMGGLLARAYIQSNGYQGDVENLIMLGTPHKGAANAYYIWEGGDAVTADAVATGSYLINKHPYLATLLALIADSDWSYFSDISPLLDQRLWDYLNTHSFVNKHLLTARQLLPTYLCLDNNTTCKAITSEGNINQDLINLNNNPNRFRMGPPTSAGKVRTRVYFSTSEQTVDYIKVTSRSIRSILYGLYQDGEPVGKQVSYTTGDGTVPMDSATLPIQEEPKWAEVVASSGPHISLVGKNKDDIAGYLYPQVASVWGKARALIAAYFSLKVSPANAQVGTSPVSPIFCVTFNGWVQTYLADPQGRGVGINPVSGAMENAIPEAVIATEADSGSIALDSPVDGNYTISLKGKFACSYRLTLGYQDNDNFVFQELSGFNNANTTSFTVRVDSTAPQRIIINPPVTAPTRLVTYAVNGKTKLTWQASTDPGVGSYKIYAKSPDAPFFALIGSTSGTTFMTNDPWLDYNSTLATMYAIVALKSDGTESFFSNRALNKTKPLLKQDMAPILYLLLEE